MEPADRISTEFQWIRPNEKRVHATQKLSKFIANVCVCVYIYTSDEHNETQHRSNKRLNFHYRDRKQIHIHADKNDHYGLYNKM